MANGTSLDRWLEADACAFRVLSNSWIIGVSRLNATWWGSDEWSSRARNWGVQELCGGFCSVRRCSRVESVSDETEGKGDGEKRDKIVSTTALS